MIYVICHENLISNIILLRLENPANVYQKKYIERFSIINDIKSWEFLKKFNEIGGRAVIIERHKSKGIVEHIPFEESAIYKSRF